MDFGNVSRTASSAYGDLEYDSSSPYDSSINGETDRIATALLIDRRSRNMAPGHVRSCTPAIKAEMSLLMASRSPSSAVPSQLKNVLSPTCRSTELIELSRKSIAERENQRLRKIGHESREVYNWAGIGLRSTDSHNIHNKSFKSINLDAVSKRDPSISSSMKQWKTDRLNRSKAELRLLEEVALKRKANQYDAQIQKIKFRKNLDNFRKRLKERLTKVDDPLIGDVMRCVDYSMVHYILESHKDLNLTVDATLDFMGFPKEKKMQTEPRVEGEEIKYYDLVESPSAIDSGSWDMLPDSSLCSYSHVNFDSKDKEYSFHGVKTQIPWGMGREYSLKSKKLLSKSFSTDAGTKYWNPRRNDCINVTQKELSLRAFAEASSNGELKVVNNSNDILAYRDEYPTTKDDWRKSGPVCLLTQQGSHISQSLPSSCLSDQNILSSLSRDNVCGDDQNNILRDRGFPPTVTTTHYVFRRSSTSSSTSTSTSYSSSTGNESEISNEKDDGNRSKSVIFITAADGNSPSLAPTSFPFPAISPSSKFDSSASSANDNNYHRNIPQNDHSNRSENRNEITIGTVGDGNMGMRGNGRTVRILSFSDEIDDEATSSRGSVNGNSDSSKTNNNSNNMNDHSSSNYASLRDTHGYIGPKPKILEAGSSNPSTAPSPTLSSSSAVLRGGRRDGNIACDRDRGHEEVCSDKALIATQVTWTTAPPVPSPFPLSPPTSNTPSHALVLASLNPHNKITKTVQVPAYTDKNRNRDFERDWDKDRYGARSSLSPHLATLGKWCSPLKGNSGRYIIGHSNVNSRETERTYMTSCYSKHVSMLPLALPKPFF